jgi:hypothetical protein
MLTAQVQISTSDGVPLMSKAPARPTETRGSQKLLEKLSAQGAVPSIDDIKKALSIPSNVDLKVPNWLIRGIPPVYMELDATLQVPVAQASSVLNGLIGLKDSNINLHIFINGIPVPDIATIVLKNTPGER